jgi:hypothetical protein
MIEYMPNNNSCNYLRITTETLDSDSLFGLAALSHIYDYHSSLWYPRYENVQNLNGIYSALWLSVDASFYSSKKEWLNKTKKYFSGKLLNFNINPSVVNNVSFAYPLRIGYIKGRIFFLSGESTESIDTKSFVDFCEENFIDIGVVNLFNGSFTVSTVWNLNVTRTEEEAKHSKKFLEGIFDEVGVEPYWNTPKSHHITKVEDYLDGLYDVDLSYTDDVSSRTLIVADSRNQTAEQLKVLLRSKNMSSVELYTGNNPSSIDLSRYSSLVFFVGETYSYKNAIFLHKVRQEFDGLVLNGKSLDNLLRDKIFDLWRSAGFSCPRYKSAFGYTIPELEEVDFGPPYIIRAVKGHNATSNMSVVHDYQYVKEWPWWIWGDCYADFMIEEFIDVSAEGTYDVGRAMVIGETVIPFYALRCRSWEARPLRDRVVLRSVGTGCFEEVIRGFGTVESPYEVLRNVINVLGIDVGVVDFSVKEGKIIPWDVTIKWGHGLINHWIEDSSRNFSLFVNNLMKLVNNPLRITSKEAQNVLEESELEIRLWNRVAVLV